ncbi:MAG: hypothetical protein A2W68_03790 [Betaproteobacteria bacterium RIFCSPLOWO2_02_64_14]|nr:MAG: hypothetical protein A2W68_03790 [Betaproteobacteria bacterium RIFCSPLOWO2_02_64_14]
MVIVRLIGILVLLAIGLALVLYLFTRNRRFLTAAWRIFQFGVILLIVFMALFVLERLIMYV